MTGIDGDDAIEMTIAIGVIFLQSIVAKLGAISLHRLIHNLDGSIRAARALIVDPHQLFSGVAAGIGRGDVEFEVQFAIGGLVIERRQRLPIVGGLDAIAIQGVIKLLAERRGERIVLDLDGDHQNMVFFGAGAHDVVHAGGIVDVAIGERGDVLRAVVAIARLREIFHASGCVFRVVGKAIAADLIVIGLIFEASAIHATWGRRRIRGRRRAGHRRLGVFPFAIAHDRGHIAG